MTAATLTQQERQVLERMAMGHDNGQIGRALFIAEDTVKSHARKVFRKLGASSRTSAVVMGLQAGAITVPGLVATDAAPAPALPQVQAGDPPEPTVRLTATRRDAHVLVRAWLGGKLPDDARRRAQLEQHALAALQRLVGSVHA